MAQFKKNELVLEHVFDTVSNRHFINGMVSVLHCHHFTALYSQLADDCTLLDGKALLAQCAEDTFYEVLVNYFKANKIETLVERVSIAEQYYAAVGLGKLQVTAAGLDSGNVRLEHSHIDEGWIKKWGKREAPVNFITKGYIAAVFSAIFDRSARTYNVIEEQSVISGADCSIFRVVIN